MGEGMREKLEFAQGAAQRNQTLSMARYEATIAKGQEQAYTTALHFLAEAEASIAANLSALDDLRPRDAVVLPSGLAIECMERAVEDENEKVIIETTLYMPSYGYLDLGWRFRPLLEAAVRGGAYVVRKEEEQGA